VKVSQSGPAAVERMGCLATPICKAGAHGLKRLTWERLAVTERADRTQSINELNNQDDRAYLPLDVTLLVADACSFHFHFCSFPTDCACLPSSRHLKGLCLQATRASGPHRGSLGTEQTSPLTIWLDGEACMYSHGWSHEMTGNASPCPPKSPTPR
jgi:hypothetical protein